MNYKLITRWERDKIDDLDELDEQDEIDKVLVLVLVYFRTIQNN